LGVKRSKSDEVQIGCSGVLTLIGVNLKKVGLEEEGACKENTKVSDLVESHKLLGLVKAERQRHRENAAGCSLIWACSG
jgi:hypothetical protein